VSVKAREPKPPATTPTQPKAVVRTKPVERTVMLEAPSFSKAGRAWRPFRFQNLEKVSRLQVQLQRRLEWMLPGIKATGEVSETVNARLKELLDAEVSLSVDYVHVVQPKALRKYITDPTFLAILAPQPHKTRGFLEVDLGLAHAAIDMLLGGAGEAMALRPLTDIEEGVMTYVIIEVLKSFAPTLDPALPRLRLEGVARGFDEVVQLLGDEQHLAAVQLKAVLGSNTGYLRLFIPASVLSQANPPSDAAVRRSRRASEAVANIGRLKSVKTWMRAEIGYVEITSSQLMDLGEGDAIILDKVTARPDKGEGGTAMLKVGMGRVGHLEAELAIEGDKIRATIKSVELAGAEQPGPGSEEAAREQLEAQEQSGEDGEAPAALGDGPDESTNPGAPEKRVDETLKGKEGADLLNDIPLQIAVELARVPITAEEVVGLKVGQVVDLNRVPGEPIDLSVNGRIVARGELVEIDGNLGVRVLSLAG
jgi:flagellar motor switch protein FliM